MNLPDCNNLMIKEIIIIMAQQSSWLTQFDGFSSTWSTQVLKGVVPISSSCHVKLVISSMIAHSNLVRTVGLGGAITSKSMQFILRK